MTRLTQTITEYVHSILRGPPPRADRAPGSQAPDPGAHDDVYIVQLLKDAEKETK